MNPVTSVLTIHTALVLLSSNIYQNSGGMKKKQKTLSSQDICHGYTVLIVSAAHVYYELRG